MSHYYRILRLGETPNAVPQLSTLMQDVWPEHYGPEGEGNAEADLKARMGGDEMPLAIVVLDDKDHAVGGGALGSTSFGADEGETPWVIGVCIHPNHRRIGLASQVIAMLEAEANRLGFGQVFSTVSDMSNLMSKRGWHALRQVSDNDSWQVMLKKVA